MTKYKRQAATTFTTDTQGNRLAHAALSGTDLRATLNAEDLENLLAAGWSPYWSFAGDGCGNRYAMVYVCSPQGRKRATTVARLIAKVGKGEVVTYADGDRLNLRRDNLLVKKGTAWTPLDVLQPRKGVPQGAPGPQTHLVASPPQMFTANFREGIEQPISG